METPIGPAHARWSNWKCLRLIISDCLSNTVDCGRLESCTALRCGETLGESLEVHSMQPRPTTQKNRFGISGNNHRAWSKGRAPASKNRQASWSRCMFSTIFVCRRWRLLTISVVHWLGDWVRSTRFFASVYSSTCRNAYNVVLSFEGSKWVVGSAAKLPEGTQPQITPGELLECERIIQDDPTVQKLAKEVGAYISLTDSYAAFLSAV